MWGYGYAKGLSKLPFLETLLVTEKAERFNVWESSRKWRNSRVKKFFEISYSKKLGALEKALSSLIAYNVRNSLGHRVDQIRV